MKIYGTKKPFIAPAKSVFMQGFEDILAIVFSFEEFVQELIDLFNWTANPQNPLYQHHYT